MKNLKLYLLKLSLQFSLYQPYWKTRFHIQRIIFIIQSKLFKGRDSLFNSIQDAQIFWSMVKTVFFSFLLAALILLVTHLLTPANFQVNQENFNAFDNLMIAITGISGVFLSFYFSNLSTIISISYAKLPHRIRQLIIEEKVGNLSLRFVVFLNALSLMTLSSAIIWNIRSVFSVYVLSLLSAFSIFIASFLLRRIFIFIDPTSFINLVISKFWKWFNFSTTDGYLWKEPSFQNYYHSQAQNTLSDIRILFDLAVTTHELQNDRLHSVLMYINSLHKQYIKKKELVPTNSKWFSLVPHHKDWYLADSYELALATNTNTFIQPTLRPDLVWVEKLLNQMNLDVLNTLHFKDKNIIELMNGINDIIYVYGELWRLGQAKEIVENLGNIILSRIASSKENEYFEQKIIFLDLLGLYPISMFLGFKNKLTTINIEILLEKIKTIDWKEPQHIYNLELPYPVLERLEFLQKRLEYERKTEGKIVSPPWYITLLISQSLAFSFKTQLDIVFSFLEDFYIKIAETLIQKNQFAFAIQIISRGLEFSNKLSHNINIIQEIEKTFLCYKYIKSLPWPEMDWKKFQFELINRNNQQVILLSQCITNFPKTEFSENFPDYFGLAVHTSGEALYSAMEGNNHLLFEKLYQNYFHGILRIHDRLLKRDPMWSHSDQMIALSEPILDLINLSGYAYIFSEYHQNSDIWTTCKNCWDHFLESVDAPNLIKQIGTMIYQNNHLFAVTPRSLTRSNWEIRLNHSLNKYPRKSKLVFSFHSLQIIDHPSLLIRVIGGTDNFGYHAHSASDVFIDLYLKSFPESKNIDFGNRNNLRETLSRWQEDEEEPENSVDEV